MRNQRLIKLLAVLLLGISLGAVRRIKLPRNRATN